MQRYRDRSGSEYHPEREGNVGVEVRSLFKTALLKLRQPWFNVYVYAQTAGVDFCVYACVRKAIICVVLKYDRAPPSAAINS